MINTKHPQYKNLSAHEIESINCLHKVREYIEKTALQSDIKTAKILYPLWIENERTLQQLWQFKVDDKYIKTWWYPKCTCPKMDNDDAYPTGYYYVNTSCPIHGELHD